MRILGVWNRYSKNCLTKNSDIFIISKVCETIKLNLSDVFTSYGKIRTEHLEYQGDNFDLTYTTYPVVAKSPIELKFEAYELGKVRVTGGFSLTMEIPCDRCLEPVETKVDCEFDTEVFAPNVLALMEDADDMSYLDGYEFDVTDFVNLSVLMNMPSKVLCREDCKGLCPVCGCNLNEKNCGCDSFVPDPRMANIMDIFNASKEV